MSTSSINPRVSMTLTEAVDEVLLILSGQTLHYDSQYDRFRAITGCINRALRGNAMEQEWGYYSERLMVGPVVDGVQVYQISADYRFRVKDDDAARLVTAEGVPQVWAYFLPRDSLHKYRNRNGLWASATRNELLFSRPLEATTPQLYIEVPVMREPSMFRLPAAPYETKMVPTEEDPEILEEVTLYPDVLEDPVDFDFPDLITARAAWLYAQTDPVLQPRVQTLEESYKGLMYQAMERDSANTDTPYQNELIVPVQNTIYGESTERPWPVANRR